MNGSGAWRDSSTTTGPGLGTPRPRRAGAWRAPRERLEPEAVEASDRGFDRAPKSLPGRELFFDSPLTANPICCYRPASDFTLRPRVEGRDDEHCPQRTPANRWRHALSHDGGPSELVAQIQEDGKDWRSYLLPSQLPEPDRVAVKPPASFIGRASSESAISLRAGRLTS